MNDIKKQQQEAELKRLTTKRAIIAGLLIVATLMKAASYLAWVTGSLDYALAAILVSSLFDGASLGLLAIGD